MKKNILSDDLYEIDISLSLFFAQTFGEDEYYNFKENATLKEYKTNFNKLISSLKKTFENTVNSTDQIHKEQINNLISQEKKNIQKCNSVEDIYKSLIIFYPKLYFLILGEIPLNLNKKRVSNWSMNSFRQIEYKQNSIQKSNLLINLLEKDKVKEIEPYNDLLEKYNQTHNSKESFIDWFKRNYPIHYINIFDL
ncbi:hypothetical protein [Empedobacter falsenii]